MVRIRSHHLIGDSVIHAVIFGLPPTTTVKAVITIFMFVNARPLESMPVPEPAIHQAIGLKTLPVRPCAQNGDAAVLKFRHVLQASGHQSCSRPSLWGRIQEITRVKEIPMA